MAPPNKLPTHKLGKFGPEIPAIGLGLMGISMAYGPIDDDETRLKVLDRAWELGCTNWDTAAGYGDSEELIGKWFKLYPQRRQDIFLATKFALGTHVREDGTYDVVLDSSPENTRVMCLKSLGRLQTDYIDLYYVHRVDGKTPIEKSVAAMAQLKKEGKVKHLGLSEVSSKTLRRACAVEHIDAVQMEYSPWCTEIEGLEGTNLLNTCRELGTAVFCYSPLGRGIITGKYKSIDDFEPKDARRIVPYYQADNFAKNLKLVDKFQEMAAKKGRTSSQLALAWLTAQGNDIFAIPGTKKLQYLEENIGSAFVKLTKEEEQEIRAAVNLIGVSGGRARAFGSYCDTPELEV